jgi:gas vesicle protein
MAEMKKASSSHLGAGLAAGAALGLAAGLFLQSRKGKELTRDAMKKAPASPEAGFRRRSRSQET